MGVTYGFFNSVNHDRKYSAEDFSRIFDGILNDGVFATVGNHLRVTATSGRNVTIGTGRAWFESTWTYNDSLYLISLDNSPSGVSRIDAICLNVDHNPNVRANKFVVIQGVPALDPVKPTIPQTDKMKNHVLAYVTVHHDEAISQANIENVIGTSETPYVTGILATTSVDELWAQWDAEFNIWWDSIRAILDDNTVTRLQNEIDNLKPQPNTILKYFDTIEDAGDNPSDAIFSKISDEIKDASVQNYDIIRTYNDSYYGNKEDYIKMPKEASEIKAILDRTIDPAITRKTMIYADTDAMDGDGYNDKPEFVFDGTTYKANLVYISNDRTYKIYHRCIVLNGNTKTIVIRHDMATGVNSVIFDELLSGVSATNTCSCCGELGDSVIFILYHQNTTDRYNYDIDICSVFNNGASFEKLGTTHSITITPPTDIYSGTVYPSFETSSIMVFQNGYMYIPIAFDYSSGGSPTSYVQIRDHSILIFDINQDLYIGQESLPTGYAYKLQTTTSSNLIESDRYIIFKISDNKYGKIRFIGLTDSSHKTFYYIHKFQIIMYDASETGANKYSRIVISEISPRESAQMGLFYNVFYDDITEAYYILYTIFSVSDTYVLAKINIENSQVSLDTIATLSGASNANIRVTDFTTATVDPVFVFMKNGSVNSQTKDCMLFVNTNCIGPVLEITRNQSGDITEISRNRAQISFDSLQLKGNYLPKNVCIMNPNILTNDGILEYRKTSNTSFYCTNGGIPVINEDASNYIKIPKEDA